MFVGGGDKSRRGAARRGEKAADKPDRLRRPRRPQGWGPAGVLGTHGRASSAGTRKPGEGRGPPTPRHSKTPREPGQGGAGRGLDSWRRAPTRLERLSASGLLPPRALKGSAGEPGSGEEGWRAEVRAGDPWVPGVSPDLSESGRCELPGTCEGGGRPAREPTLCAAAGAGDGVRGRVTWAPERSQRQQEPERRRPARGRHGPRRAVGAARGCSCRAPGPARGSRGQPPAATLGRRAWLAPRAPLFPRRRQPALAALPPLAPARSPGLGRARPGSWGPQGLSAPRPRRRPRTWPELRRPRRRRRGSCAPAPVP